MGILWGVGMTLPRCCCGELCHPNRQLLVPGSCDTRSITDQRHSRLSPILMRKETGARCRRGRALGRRQLNHCTGSLDFFLTALRACLVCREPRPPTTRPPSCSRVHRGVTACMYVYNYKRLSAYGRHASPMRMSTPPRSSVNNTRSKGMPERCMLSTGSSALGKTTSIAFRPTGQGRRRKRRENTTTRKRRRRKRRRGRRICR